MKDGFSKSPFMKSIGDFLKSNWMSILWFVVYFIVAWLMFGAGLESFLFVLGAYAVSLTIALSPVGEYILRLSQGARLVGTRQEREYLMPLFEDVYQAAMVKQPRLSRKIKLYMEDAMHVNAYAVGRNTVVVTKGAMEAFSEDELKGVLAHEFGHLAHGDTKALLLNVVGNGLFTVIILIMRVCIFVCNLMYAALDSSGALGIFVTIVRFIFDIGIFLFLALGQIILAIDSRRGEYRADAFAYHAGYGEELTQALYLLQNISMNQKVSLFERLKSSHPNLAARITRLEMMDDAKDTTDLVVG